MEWLRNNCYLTGGDGVKRPVYISTVRTSPYELTSFEGYFRDDFSFYLDRDENKEMIKQVIFNDPATIVLWADGTKTVVKCQDGDIYDKEKGLALAISKKYFSNKGNFNEVFKKWIPEDIPVEEMRKKLDKFCEDKACSDCQLKSPVCRCGHCTHFLTKYDGVYDMSDDEIRDAYKIVFEK